MSQPHTIGHGFGVEKHKPHLCGHSPRAGPASVSVKLGGLNILPAVLITAATTFSVLHIRTITPASEEQLKQWLVRNYLPIMVLAALALLLLTLFGHHLHDWLFAHKPVLFVVLTFWLGAVLELFALYRSNAKPAP